MHLGKENTEFTKRFKKRGEGGNKEYRGSTESIKNEPLSYSEAQLIMKTSGQGFSFTYQGQLG